MPRCRSCSIGRFLGGDPLAIGGDLCLAAADLLVDLRGAGVQFHGAGLGGLDAGQSRVAVGGQVADAAFGLGQALAQPPPIGQPDLRPQFLQAVGVFLVAPGLGGLGADAPQAAFDFVDDVGQPQQVLLDPLQPPQGFDLLGLEAADAGRLFEDHAAVAGRGLQQHVDFALLDDAVGFGGQAGAGQQVADVAQPAGLAIDQIFALAAAVDAAGDVHFGRVDRQQPLGSCRT